MKHHAPSVPRLLAMLVLLALPYCAAPQAQTQVQVQVPPPATEPDSAQAVASLYPPQPPANAAYLRVFNASVGSIAVSVPGSIGSQTQPVPHNGVTRLSVVPLGQPLNLVLAGQAPLPPLQANGGEVMTVILRHDAQGWHSTRVVDKPQPSDGLKATLHAYNLLAGCSADITLGANGPAVFAALVPGTPGTRAINPVAATLVGHCGAANTTFALPMLRGGDSYSLFLGGDAIHPVLLGVLDSVAWPPAIH